LQTDTQKFGGYLGEIERKRGFERFMISDIYGVIEKERIKLWEEGV
jgi:hypothetical protein